MCNLYMLSEEKVHELHTWMESIQWGPWEWGQNLPNNICKKPKTSVSAVFLLHEDIVIPKQVQGKLVNVLGTFDDLDSPRFH